MTSSSSGGQPEHLADLADAMRAWKVSTIATQAVRSSPKRAITRS
jgi:hypothetical protein